MIVQICFFQTCDSGARVSDSPPCLEKQKLYDHRELIWTLLLIAQAVPLDGFILN